MTAEVPSMDVGHMKIAERGVKRPGREMAPPVRSVRRELFDASRAGELSGSKRKHDAPPNKER